MKTIKDYIKPITIGDVTVPGNVFLAPCSGYSDWPERLLCKQMGSAYCVGEFVSIEGLIRDCGKTLDLLAYKKEELPVAAQIYGDIPEHVPEAAQIVEEMGYSILDINMGCPAKKVCRHGAGSALLKDPDRAVAMTENAVKAVKIPVTVKMRTGFYNEHRNAIELAQRLVDVGAQMITLHGRTAAQGYKGEADWEFIARMKEGITGVPVIGNGDITNAREAREMMQRSGVDGVMIGRGAFGNPWVFRDCLEGTEEHSDTPPGERHDFYEVLDRHAQYMAERYGEGKGAILFRKHAVRYTKGMRGARQMRESLCHAETVQEMRQIMDFHKSSAPLGPSIASGAPQGLSTASGGHSRWS